MDRVNGPIPVKLIFDAGNLLVLWFRILWQEKPGMPMLFVPEVRIDHITLAEFNIG